MTQTIKAIETRYKGYRFRSRLEARWAVFFDALGLDWEYEAEGYELSDGTRYLPDFKMTDTDQLWSFVEIKPLVSWTEGTLDDDLTRTMQFATDMNTGVFVCHGDPMEHKTTYLMEAGPIFVDGESQASPWNYHMPFGKDGDYINRSDWDVIYRARLKARGARFEHGECG